MIFLLLMLWLTLACLNLHSRDRGFVTGYDLNDLSSSSSSPSQKSTLLSYLQHESIQMTKIQQSLMKQLHSKKISIGERDGSISKQISSQNSKLKVAVSTAETPLECRITLGSVPEGKKCSFYQYCVIFHYQ